MRHINSWIISQKSGSVLWLDFSHWQSARIYQIDECCQEAQDSGRQQYLPPIANLIPLSRSSIKSLLTFCLLLRAAQNGSEKPPVK